jgi:hypothetical protein
MSRRVTIRESSYRGRQGFLILGRDASGQWPGCKMFTDTRSSADHIKRKLLAGERVETEDFQPRGTA